MSGILQLELVGLTVPGARPRAQLERIILDAAQACEFSRWMAYCAKTGLDGLHPARWRWRRRRSLRGAEYWSDVAFAAARALPL